MSGYAADATGAVYQGSTACLVKFAVINTNVNGAVLVAAVPGKKIRVLSYVVVAAGAVNISFSDGSAGLTGPLVAAAAGQGVSAPYSPVGQFETPVGLPLYVILSAGIFIGGHLTYIEVS